MLLRLAFLNKRNAVLVPCHLKKEFSTLDLT